MIKKLRPTRIRELKMKRLVLMIIPTVMICGILFIGCDSDKEKKIGIVTFGANYHVINCVTKVTIFLDGENIGTLQNYVDAIHDCGEIGTLTKEISVGKHTYKVEIRPPTGEGCKNDITGTFTISENECEKIFIDFFQLF